LPRPVKVKNDSSGHSATPEPVAPADPATLVPREPFAPGKRAWWQSWRVMVVVWLIIIGFVWMGYERHVDKSVIAAGVVIIGLLSNAFAWLLGVIALVPIVGPLIVKARDVRYIIRYVLSFWYFLTPVLYATSNLPSKYRVFSEYNPLAAPIELIKNGLLGSGGPGHSSMLVCLIGLAVMLPAGLLTASHFERQVHARI